MWQALFYPMRSELQTRLLSWSLHSNGGDRQETNKQIYNRMSDVKSALMEVTQGV